MKIYGRGSFPFPATTNPSIKHATSLKCSIKLFWVNSRGPTFFFAHQRPKPYRKPYPEPCQEPCREPCREHLSSKRLDAERHYVILAKALDGIWPVGHACAVLC